MVRADQSSRSQKKHGSSSRKPPGSPEIGESEPVTGDVIVRKFVELYVLCGFRSDGYSTKGDALHWDELISASGGNWVKAVKYKIAAFYQFHNNDQLVDTTLPEKPFTVDDHPGRLLGGKAGRFEQKMARHKNRVSKEEFLSSILLSKFGFPRPDEAFLAKAKSGTVTSLVTKRNRLTSLGFTWQTDASDQVNAHRVTFASIKQEVVRTTKEFFNGKKFTSGDLLAHPSMPSLSANNTTSRAKLGTFGYLRESGLLAGEDALVLPPVLRELPLVEQPHDEEHITNSLFSNHRTMTLEGINGMRDQYVKTYFDTLRVAMDEQPVAEGVALAEALKARIITKGPPATQFCLKPLQRFMWQALAETTTCQLVGKPADAATCNATLGMLRPGEAWLSGDYSEATNLIDPLLSSLVWDTMCTTCSVPEALRQLGHRALTGHLIKQDSGELLPQQWGQLMGSIISFPVLCVINAAICRMAIEFSQGRRIFLRRCPLLVNGDDCVFRVTEAGYRFWGVAGRLSGLHPSIGKVYFSRTFMNINSTNFQYWAEPRSWAQFEDSYVHEQFTQTKAIRYGLLVGLKRSEVSFRDSPLQAIANSISDDYSSLGSRHATLMNETPERFREAVHRSFIRRNQEVLTRSQLPWYVPKCYGGIGLTPVPEYGNTFSVLDAQIVRAMVSQHLWNHGVTQEDPRSFKTASSTRIHEAAMQVLDYAAQWLQQPISKRWVLEDSEEEDGYSVPELDLWIVYLFPEEVEAATSSNQIEAGLDVLNHNRRLWRWYERHVSQFGWLDGFAELKSRRVVHDVTILSETGKPYVGSVYPEPGWVGNEGQHPSWD